MRDVTGSIHKLGALTGHTLHARDGEIGTLAEIYFDDESWTTRYFVVHTGGWLLGRDVLIARRHVVGLEPTRPELKVDLSRAQVEGSPPVDAEKPVSRHYELRFSQYYGLAPYWNPAGPLELPRRLAEPLRIPSRDAREPERPHLRSSQEVSGYHIQAADGAVGHVADLLIADGDWRICFLEIETRNWWPGRHVLIAPAWIERVSWADREVSVIVSREAVRTAPAYDPAVGIGPDDEIRVFEHYGQDFARR